MKKSNIPIALIILATIADPIERRNDQLYLTAPSCPLARKMVQSLSKWTAKSESASSCAPKFNPVVDRCEAEITHCVPEHVRKYQGLLSKNEGPNCWNFALVMSRLLPDLRYSTAVEMQFYMESPLCRALEKDEPREPGDVVAIRKRHPGQGNEEVHGFIYVSEDLAYAKDGKSPTEPYGLMSTKEVFDKYPVTASKDCPTCSPPDFFRCQSFDEYLGQNKNLPTELLEKIGAMNNFERCFQREALTGQVLSDEAVESILHISQSLLNYTKTAIHQDGALKGKDQRFVIASLLLRLDAIAQNMALLPEGTAAASDLARLTQESLEAGKFQAEELLHPKSAFSP